MVFNWHVDALWHFIYCKGKVEYFLSTDYYCLQDLFPFAPAQSLFRLYWNQKWEILKCIFHLIKLGKASTPTNLMMVALSSKICTGARDPLSKTTSPSPTRQPSVIFTGAKGPHSSQLFHSPQLWGMGIQKEEHIGTVNDTCIILRGFEYDILFFSNHWRIWWNS